MEDSLLLPCWDVGKNVLFEPALLNSRAACAQHAVIAQGPFALGTGTSDRRPLGQRALAQFAPRGAVGADTRLMESTRQTGAYQTACNYIQQWQRTMNPIIYKKTVQVFPLVSPYYACLLPLFFCGAACRGCGNVNTVVSKTFS